VVVCALATTGGVPAVVAAAATADACGDDCGDETRSCPGGDGEGDDDAGCPPFCHGCLCRVQLGTPAPLATVRARVGEPELISIAPLAPRLQTPPPRGVFHPPRPSA
jgi:hypothetical protein